MALALLSSSRIVPQINPGLGLIPPEKPAKKALTALKISTTHLGSKMRVVRPSMMSHLLVLVLQCGLVVSKMLVVFDMPSERTQTCSKIESYIFFLLFNIQGCDFWIFFNV